MTDVDARIRYSRRELLRLGGGALAWLSAGGPSGCASRTPLRIASVNADQVQGAVLFSEGHLARPLPFDGPFVPDFLPGVEA